MGWSGQEKHSRLVALIVRHPSCGRSQQIPLSGSSGESGATDAARLPPEFGLVYGYIIAIPPTYPFCSIAP